MKIIDSEKEKMVRCDRDLANQVQGLAKALWGLDQQQAINIALAEWLEHHDPTMQHSGTRREQTE